MSRTTFDAPGTEARSPSVPAWRRAQIARGGVIGTGLAIVATLVVYVVGDQGTPTRVVTGWSPDGADLRLVEVIGTVVVSVLLGAVVLWLLERRSVNGFRTWVIVAAALAVVSALPLLPLDVDAASKATLATMHIVIGICAIGAQTLVRRGRPAVARGW